MLSFPDTLFAALCLVPGAAVFSLDFEGHGKSDGLLTYIPDFDQLVRDAATLVNTVSLLSGFFDQSQPAGMGQSVQGLICDTNSALR